MAKITVRYLVMRPGAPGAPPRYFWQPSASLRAQGWQNLRIPETWASIDDPAALEDAGIAAARELNTQLDLRREAAHHAAIKASPLPTATRTLGELIKLFKASGKFVQPGISGSLRESTQRGYRQCLAKLEAWGADVPVRAIDAVASSA